MARRLEEQVFYTCTNNGVTALVSREVLFDTYKVHSSDGIFYALHNQIGGGEGDNEKILGIISRALPHLGTPIFTFANAERVETQPWFTSDLLFYQKLVEYITSEGGRVESSSVHVPFSNGSEMGYHGEEVMERELRFVTSRQQFCETFGISYDEMLKRVKEHATAHANSEG